MIRVFACIHQQHDIRLVLLAALLCALGCYTTQHMLGRARAGAGAARLIWTAAAAFAFGCCVWSTHFVAILAFDPGMPMSYAILPTVASLGVALAGSLAAFMLHLARPGSTKMTVLAGTVLGGAIGGLHFLGMAGLELPGLVTYDPAGVVWSLGLGMAFSAAALLGTERLPTRAGVGAGAVLLAAAICALHFTAMAAVTILPLANGTSDDLPIPPGLLAVAVAAISLLVLALSLIGSVLDQHLARRSAREAWRLRRFADSTFEGIVFHRDGVITDANAELCRMRGCAAAELVGMPLQELFAASSRALIRAPADVAATQEALLLDDGGQEHPVELLRRTFDHDGIDQDGLATEVLVLRDVADRKQAEQRISQLAHYDALTGLANRLLFRDRLAQALATAARTGQGVALLCVDLDRFKTVNDLLGHQAGDRLLVAVADRLATATREMDTVARLGGDEFAIVQPFSSPTDPATLAARLVACLNEPYDVGGQQASIGVSIGIGLCPADGHTPETLMCSADLALYRAKQDGNGGFRFFEPDMDTKLQQRRMLEQELRGAIGAGELELDYQPLFDSGSLDVVGYEALVRWRHPQRGRIPPAEFIPLAEESGLILPLGRWVLEAACAEAASWPVAHCIAVNLSPVQFKQADLPQMLTEILAHTGLAPSRLELEVTEGVLIVDTERALATLRKLKGLGIRIALDDFGTGYSSLSYLRRFPFDKLKIDRSFVQGLGEDDDADAIVRSILALCQSLRLSVTAEGVETASQLERLREQRCDQVQGFLLGRPVAPEQLHHLGKAIAA